MANFILKNTTTTVTTAGQLEFNTGKTTLVVGDGSNEIIITKLDSLNNGSLYLNNEISTSGNITASNMFISGNLNVSGNLFLGNNVSDNINALGVFQSNLRPGSPNAFDIGIVSNEWRSIFANSISASFITGSVDGVNVGLLSTRVGQLSAATASINTYTASNDTTNSLQNDRLSRIEESTASLNTYTASNDTTNTLQNARLSQIETQTGSLLNYTGSFPAETVTFTNKTISGTNNTLTNIGNASLTNSTITIAGTSTALGGSITAATILSGTGVISGSEQLPAGTISGSSQVNFTQINGISANIISASTDTSNVDMIISGGSISANLYGGVVSGSSQVTISSTTGFSSFSSSQADTDAIQNSRLSALEISSASVHSYTASLKTALDVSGQDLTILGNLTVQGTQTTLNTNEVIIEDKTLTLASGSATSAAADGAGIQIAGANVTMSWDNSNSRVLLNKNLGIEGSISSSTLVGLNNQTVSAYSTSVDARLSNLQLTSASLILTASNLNAYTQSFPSATVTFTNKSISGTTNTLTNIGNASLTNNSITIAGQSTSLGGTVTTDTIRAAIGTVVTGSSQIDFTGLSGISANIISASTDTSNVDIVISGGSISANLYGGVVSGSSQVNHNATTNYDSNQHIDHTSVSITAGTGLSGGGTIAATRTLSIDSTVATLTGTQTLTNKTINASQLVDASVTNAKLTNSSITIAGQSTALGSTVTADTIRAAIGTVLTGSAQALGILSSLNTFTASIALTNDYTQSNNTTNSLQNDRLSRIEESTASLNTFTGSTFVSFSSSVDDRLDDLVYDVALLTPAGLSASFGALNSYTASFPTASVTFTNKTINGSDNTLTNIANSSLSNSSITIAGNSTALGGSITAATILAGTGVISGSAQLPSGVVSGSSQITYANISSIPAGIVSGSAQVTPLLPNGTVSGSSQITYASISSIPSGIVSGSAQVTPLLPAGTISGSSQVTISSTTGFSSFSSSVDSRITTEKGRVDAILLAADADKDSFAEIVALINSVDTTNDNAFASFYTSSVNRLNELESFTSSINTTIKSKLNTDGVISGSSQVTGIGNAQLTNSSITIAGNSTALGGSITAATILGGTGVISGSTQLPAGTVSGSSQVFSNISGDVLIASNGVATIQANSVALGTDTTGDYVSSLVAGTNITLSNNSGEGATPTIALTNSAITIAGTSTSLGGSITAATILAGTGVISGSAQLPAGVVSGSSQVFSNISGDVLIASNGVATIQANSVALGTDTTGNYMADVSAGNAGINISHTAGEGSTATISLVSGVVSGSSQITAGSTTNFATDVKTQLNSNTVISGSSQVYSGVSGDVTIASNGVASIAANSVALGTDTTGDYVGAITAGSGISSTGATSGEGIGHTLSVATGGVTDAMLAGSISNAKLSNSAITIAGTSTSLGGTISAATIAGQIGNYVATISGTSNQITVAGSGNNAAAITLSTPQNIHTTATPQFGSLGIGMAASGTTGRIDATNDIVAFSSSDKRFKNNLKPIEKALEKIEEVGGYEFDWNEQLKFEHGYEGHDIGVIAQEIEAIAPELVQTRENGYKAVKYDKIIPILIQAIKELSAKVKELESK